MKIWIHKQDDYLRKFLQPDTEIQYIEDYAIVDNGIVMLRSDEEIPASIQNCLIIHYDKDLASIRQLALQKLDQNYDYYELDYQLNRDQKFDTCIVGSSYALFGFDMKLLPTWRNLAMGSQDIYYSYQLARKLYEKCKYRRLFWGGHYYTVYSDLSRGKNQSELLNITYIYSKIFPNSLGMHNALLIPKREEEKSLSALYDIGKSVKIFIKDYFDENGGSYWHQQRSRFFCRMKLWSGEETTWLDAAEYEKIKAGKYRAELHNKSIRYVQSLEENIGILNEMGNWCLKNNIELYIVNFPVSKYYHRAENKAFREIFYDIIKSFTFPAVLFDFQEIEFGDECFNDPDHLNDTGAKRLTEVLLGKGL